MKFAVKSFIADCHTCNSWRSSFFLVNKVPIELLRDIIILNSNSQSKQTFFSLLWNRCLYRIMMKLANSSLLQQVQRPNPSYTRTFKKLLRTHKKHHLKSLTSTTVPPSPHVPCSTTYLTFNLQFPVPQIKPNIFTKSFQSANLLNRCKKNHLTSVNVRQSGFHSMLGVGWTRSKQNAFKWTLIIQIRCGKKREARKNGGQDEGRG